MRNSILRDSASTFSSVPCTGKLSNGEDDVNHVKCKEWKWGQVILLSSTCSLSLIVGDISSVLHFVMCKGSVGQLGVAFANCVFFAP